MLVRKVYRKIEEAAENYAEVLVDCPTTIQNYCEIHAEEFLDFCQESFREEDIPFRMEDMQKFVDSSRKFWEYCQELAYKRVSYNYQNPD